MAELKLPEQTVDTVNKIQSVRLVLSLLRSADDGAGNVDIVDNPTGLALAKAFFKEYSQEVGFDPDLAADDATPAQLAACIFRRFRRMIADAYKRDQLQPVQADYSAAAQAENAQSQTELDAAVGTDEPIS